MFGQKPNTFESRIIANIQSIRVHKLFLDGLHPESKKEMNAGIPHCKDFFKFVKDFRQRVIGYLRQYFYSKK